MDVALGFAMGSSIFMLGFLCGSRRGFDAAMQIVRNQHIREAREAARIRQ